MKKMKFKILALFMMIVLIGIGASAVFAQTEKYVKLADVCEEDKVNPGTRQVFKVFKNSKGQIYEVEYSKNGTKTQFGNLYNAYMEDVVVFSGEEYIKLSDWNNFIDAAFGYNESDINGPKYLKEYAQRLSVDIEISTPPDTDDDDDVDYTNSIGNFWGDAFDWFGGVNTSGNNGVTAGFMKGAINIIKVIGNMIFIVVTAILGVKYIWGSADAKHDVKGSLFSLVLAAVVFYGWDLISNILKGVTDSVVSNSMQASAVTIYSYILYFVNIAAIAGIIFLGVKYLMASAEGKSQLKMKMGPAFLGIIMVYATISFLNTILSIFLG